MEAPGSLMEMLEELVLSLEAQSRDQLLVERMVKHLPLHFVLLNHFHHLVPDFQVIQDMIYLFVARLIFVRKMNKVQRHLLRRLK